MCDEARPLHGICWVSCYTMIQLARKLKCLIRERQRCSEAFSDMVALNSLIIADTWDSSEADVSELDETSRPAGIMLQFCLSFAPSVGKLCE